MPAPKRHPDELRERGRDDNSGFVLTAHPGQVQGRPRECSGSQPNGRTAAYPLRSLPRCPCPEARDARAPRTRETSSIVEAQFHDRECPFLEVPSPRDPWPRGLRARSREELSGRVVAANGDARHALPGTGALVAPCSTSPAVSSLHSASPWNGASPASAGRACLRQAGMERRLEQGLDRPVEGMPTLASWGHRDDGGEQDVPVGLGHERVHDLRLVGVARTPGDARRAPPAGGPRDPALEQWCRPRARRGPGAHRRTAHEQAHGRAAERANLPLTRGRRAPG